MDYWKLLTEGPLHASEEAAVADLKNDSKSKLVRYGLIVCVHHFFLLQLFSFRAHTTRVPGDDNRTLFVLRRPTPVYVCIFGLVVRCVRRLLPAAGAKIPRK